MIPADSIMERVLLTPMQYPDNAKVTGLFDYELGGVDIGDPTQGLTGWLWTLYVDGDNVTIFKDGQSPVTLFTQAGIVDVSLAFTQNMQPTVAWKLVSGDIVLRWFDSTINNFTVTNFGQGDTPRLTLDDKREVALATSDIIFGYIRSGSLYYRMQRESFLTEHLVAAIPSGLHKLERIGMGGYQLQFELTA